MKEAELKKIIIENMQGIITDHEARNDKDTVDFYADVFVLICTEFSDQKLIEDQNIQLQRLYDWLMSENREPAKTKFTAGILRNVANEIEFRLSKQGETVRVDESEGGIPQKKTIDEWVSENYADNSHFTKSKTVEVKVEIIEYAKKFWMANTVDEIVAILTDFANSHPTNSVVAKIETTEMVRVDESDLIAELRAKLAQTPTYINVKKDLEIDELRAKIEELSNYINNAEIEAGKNQYKLECLHFEDMQRVTNENTKLSCAIDGLNEGMKIKGDLLQQANATIEELMAKIERMKEWINTRIEQNNKVKQGARTVDYSYLTGENNSCQDILDLFLTPTKDK